MNGYMARSGCKIAGGCPGFRERLRKEHSERLWCAEQMPIAEEVVVNFAGICPSGLEDFRAVERQIVRVQLAVAAAQCEILAWLRWSRVL